MAQAYDKSRIRGVSRLFWLDKNQTVPVRREP